MSRIKELLDQCTMHHSNLIYAILHFLAPKTLTQLEEIIYYRANPSL